MRADSLRSLVREFIFEAKEKKKPAATVADIVKIIVSSPSDDFEDIFTKVSKQYSNTRAQVKNIYDKKHHGDDDPRTLDR